MTFIVKGFSDLCVESRHSGTRAKTQRPKKGLFQASGKKKRWCGGEKWEDLQRVHGRAYGISCLWRRGIIKESGHGCCQSFSLGN